MVLSLPCCLLRWPSCPRLTQEVCLPAACPGCEGADGASMEVVTTPPGEGAAHPVAAGTSSVLAGLHNSCSQACLSGTRRPPPESCAAPPRPTRRPIAPRRLALLSLPRSTAARTADRW